MAERDYFRSSLEGTEHDDQSGDRILWYKGMCFLAIPIHGPFEVEKRSHDYLYESFVSRIKMDSELINLTLNELSPFINGNSINRIREDARNDLEPYWNNGFFNGSDAALAYSLAAFKNPSTILEVGAGNSTKFFRRAISDYNLATKLVAIDPQPRSEIAKVADKVINLSAMNCDLKTFSDLQCGDFLFWDGSHVCYNGSDVTRLFLEVIPALKKGVLVHVHDIHLPFEARPSGRFGGVSYGEQYVLGSMIVMNSNFRILLPVHYLWRTGRISKGGASFWFET